MFDSFGNFMSENVVHTDESSEDWLSLQEASELLDVATSTLRRWGDIGRVPMKKTLGGHRRFLRSAVVELAKSSGATVVIAPARQTSQGGWGVDTRELARHEWHARFADRSDSGRMRELGQRLLGLLIQYINRREEDQRFLSEARAVGVNYGKEAHEAAISMHDTVEAFLFFRSSFSQLTMPLPGIAQPTDLAEAAALRVRIDQFMDAILLGVIVGYEGTENEELRTENEELRTKEQK
jgi:excisionase family DNA binding protein